MRRVCVMWLFPFKGICRKQAGCYQSTWMYRPLVYELAFYWWFVQHAAFVPSVRSLSALLMSFSTSRALISLVWVSSPIKSVHGGGGVHQSKCRSLASTITSLVPGTNKRYSSQTVHYACSTVHCLSSFSIGHVIFRPVFIYFISPHVQLYRRVFFCQLSPVIDLRQCKEIVCSRNKTRIRTDLDASVVHNKKKPSCCRKACCVFPLFFRLNLVPWPPQGSRHHYHPFVHPFTSTRIEALRCA